MRFVNDITLMSCQHNRLAPRTSVDNRGVCLSCGEQPAANDTTLNTGNFEMTTMLRVAPPIDRDRGMIYRRA